MRGLLIAADVDGTLLDARGKLPVSSGVLRQRLRDIEALRHTSVHLALASSRTLRELVVLQRALGVCAPIIAEDGAVIAVDAGSAFDDEARAAVESPSRPFRFVRAGSRTLRVTRIGCAASSLRTQYTPRLPPRAIDVALATRARQGALGFHTFAAVRRALHAREASMLLDLSDVRADDRSTHRDTVNASGATLARGGRWHTLTQSAGKGPAIARLRDTFGSRGVLDVHAIGNGENDESLLRAADSAYLVREPGDAQRELRAIPGVIALRGGAGEGFVELLDLLRGHGG